jgi:phage protein D
MAARALAIYEPDPRLGRPETFYVPHFALRVGGSKLPDEVTWDVTQVSYRDSVDDMDSFDLTVANWDPAAKRAKYEGAATTQYAGTFDPGREVELRMGYVGNDRLMLTGQITTLEPSFPETGAPTLSVRGLNVLHTLRGAQHSYSWEKERDSDIAKQLGSFKPTDTKPGLGMKVEIDQAARDKEEPGYVFMDNRYDILFVLELARRNGYSVVLVEAAGSSPRHLYFGPLDASSAPPAYRLEWGRSLISVRPTLSTVKQISTVIVRGWDRRTKKAIDKRATLKDLPEAQRQELEKLPKAVRDRTEVVTEPPVHTPREAEQRAKAILKAQAAELVEASGTTVGLPDLRAGGSTHIEGLGPRYDGVYFLTSTKHTIGTGGYRTEFQGRRTGPLRGGVG